VIGVTAELIPRNHDDGSVMTSNDTSKPHAHNIQAADLVTGPAEVAYQKRLKSPTYKIEVAMKELAAEGIRPRADRGKNGKETWDEYLDHVLRKLGLPPDGLSLRHVQKVYWDWSQCEERERRDREQREELEREERERKERKQRGGI
jgi:hypothetical protein